MVVEVPRWTNAKMEVKIGVKMFSFDNYSYYVDYNERDFKPN